MRFRSTVPIVLLLASIPLQGQTAPRPSNVEFRIIDATGAAISSAEVTAKPSLSGPTISAKTDGSGIATLPLVAGSYHLSAQATGFRTETTEIDLPADAQIRTTLTLQVENGGCGVCVTVEPEVPLIPGLALTATIPELPLSGKFPLRPIKFRR